MFSAKSKLKKVVGSFEKTISDLRCLEEEFEKGINKNEATIASLEEKNDELIEQSKLAHHVATNIEKLIYPTGEKV